MYLYYFERILREASGDPALALPFWDYTDPQERALPEPFRVPAAETNALFVSDRAPGINTGALLPDSAVQFEAAMRFTNFTSPTGSAMSFGGQSIPSPSHFDGPPGQLESQPHNVIHVLVGGRTGWMSDPNLAARDPIFWFHHANVDRLWNVWRSRGGGRTNPTDATWNDTVFVFFDENGQRIEMTGREIVDSVGQLGYEYAAGTGDDDVPTLQAAGAGEDHPAEAFTDATRDVLSERASTAALGAESTVSLEVPAATTEAADDEVRYALVLEGLDFGRPGCYYEVYVGLAEDAEPDPFGPHYVGNVSFFGQGVESGGHSHAAKAVLNYEITEVVKRLQGTEGFSGELPVRFVRRELEPAEGQATLESAPGAVRFGSVKVVRE
jgi:tyrosinase